MQSYKKTKVQDSYDEIAKEHTYARWMWQAMDPFSMTRYKFLISLMICAFVMVVGYAMGGILIATLLVLFNLDLRGWLERLIVRRWSHEGMTQMASFDADGDGDGVYYSDDYPEVLIQEKGRQLKLWGLFVLAAIPLNITGTFKTFIRSLYVDGIPLSWFWVQDPLGVDKVLDSSRSGITDEAQESYERDPSSIQGRLEARQGIWEVRLLFGTRVDGVGSFHIEAIREALCKILEDRMRQIRTAFRTAYPHTKIERLHAKDLLNFSEKIPAFF